MLSLTQKELSEKLLIRLNIISNDITHMNRTIKDKDDEFGIEVFYHNHIKKLFTIKFHDNKVIVTLKKTNKTTTQENIILEDLVFDVEKNIKNINDVIILESLKLT